MSAVRHLISAYIYSWQSNLEVEEQIDNGRRRLEDRTGEPSKEEVRFAARDIAIGMFFANLIAYFIMLSTAATLHRAGTTDISTAAQAAQALRPIAGDAAGLLFAIGIVGVGFLAVPVMTTGAAYDLCQTVGHRHGLHWKPAEAKMFYGAILVFTAIAAAMNFLGVNPIKALVYAGIVQGVSTPFLTLIVMLINRNQRIMGDLVNRPAMNVLGWFTTGAMFAATIGLLLTLSSDPLECRVMEVRGPVQHPYQEDRGPWHLLRFISFCCEAHPFQSAHPYNKRCMSTTTGWECPPGANAASANQVSL